MKDVLSHFQATTKSVVAFVVAFALYVQALGRLPQTRKEWGTAFMGFVLALLVAARGSNANKDPDPPSERLTKRFAMGGGRPVPHPGAIRTVPPPVETP